MGGVENGLALFDDERAWPLSSIDGVSRLMPE